MHIDLSDVALAAGLALIAGGLAYISVAWLVVLLGYLLITWATRHPSRT